MVPREVYTKDITVMNARDDEIYEILMKVEPNYTDGDIDLLGETNCKLYLDDKLIYDGLVNGDGKPNMQYDGVTLGGYFDSGETRHLRAEFVWNITEETENYMNMQSDKGEKTYGEVSFKWIFYASLTRHKGHTVGGGGSSGGSEPTGSSSTSGGSSGDRDEPKSEVTNPSGDSEQKGDDSEPTPDDSELTGDDSEPNEDGEISDAENQDEYDPDKNAGDDWDKYHSDKDASARDGDKDGTNPDNPNGLIEKVVNKLPFIPDDVKTGYHSQLVFYTKVVTGAFGLAVVLCVLLAVKLKKLRKLKRG
jgi:hypothetical protein